VILTKENTRDINPQRFWSLEAPPSCLNQYAARIVALDPSSSDAERVHKIFKSNRTKQRNAMGYVRNQELSFGKNELTREAHLASGTQAGMSWKELIRFHDNFFAVSDIEEENLERLEKTWASAAAEEAAKEAAELSLSNVTVQAVSVGNVAVQGAGLETPERLEVVTDEAMSTRTRIRKQKQYPGYVRLHNDGGLSTHKV